MTPLGPRRLDPHVLAGKRRSQCYTSPWGTGTTVSKDCSLALNLRDGNNSWTQAGERSLLRLQDPCLETSICARDALIYDAWRCAGARKMS